MQKTGEYNSNNAFIYNGNTGNVNNNNKYNTMKYIEGKDELWPLPQSEIDTNSAIIENNPGY